MATVLVAARSVACARALDNSISSADMSYLHEQDAAATRPCTSADWLGLGEGRSNLDLNANSVNCQGLARSMSSRRLPKGSKTCTRRKPPKETSGFTDTPARSQEPRISSSPST